MFSMPNPPTEKQRRREDHAALLESQAASLESRATGYDLESLKSGLSRHEIDAWAELAGMARLDAEKFRKMAKELREK